MCFPSADAGAGSGFDGNFKAVPDMIQREAGNKPVPAFLQEEAYNESKGAPPPFIVSEAKDPVKNGSIVSPTEEEVSDIVSAPSAPAKPVKPSVGSQTDPDAGDTGTPGGPARPGSGRGPRFSRYSRRTVLGGAQGLGRGANRATKTLLGT